MATKQYHVDLGYNQYTGLVVVYSQYTTPLRDCIPLACGLWYTIPPRGGVLAVHHSLNLCNGIVYYLCNLYHVGDVEDLNVCTRNTCTECNVHNVEEVEDLTTVYIFAHRTDEREPPSRDKVEANTQAKGRCHG